MDNAPCTFSDPGSAVEEINKLLVREDWDTLARYYDLDGSRLTSVDVARWEFFAHGGTPVADPGGRTGPHHPFPPGASYLEHEIDDGVCRVSVELGEGLEEIYGSPGIRTFSLIRHGSGWRLLAPDDERLPP